MDILDEDLDLGYIPSMSRSRSNMKKLTKKEEKPMAKRPSSAYEDLEDLLAHDDKAKEKITTTKGEHHRSISREKTTVSDPYFEEPIAKLNETTKLSIFSTNQPSQFAKTQLKLSTPLEGVVEDNSPILNSFGRTQADISKVSDDQFLSMRNMKPPLRKRDSAQMNLSIGVGLVIPEEPVSSQADSEKLLSPPKLKSRRSSIESRVDQPSLTLTSLTPNEIKAYPAYMSQQDWIREDRPNLMQTTVNAAKVKETRNVTEKGDQKINTYVEGLKEGEQLREGLKQQIQHLQEAIDKQLQINKQTREQVMQECSRMIEEERARTRKIHEQDLQRVKDLCEWEKKRVQDVLQTQINTLRQSLQYAAKNSSVITRCSSQDQQEVDFLNYQLKNKQKALEDTEKLLTRRELEIEEREADFNQRRRNEEDKRREQQKTLVEEEMKLKKQVLEQKRALAEEKQQVALELARLQIDNVRKQEKAESLIREMQLERAALEKEKVENRRISREVIEENRKKGEALQTELVKVRSLEEELLANIRIVEMRLKEKVNAPKEPVQAQPDNRIGVTNNWLQEDGKEKLNKSVGNKLKSQKREQGAPVRRIPETKGSYMPDPKNNKFDLQNYIATMERYSRSKLEQY